MGAKFVMNVSLKEEEEEEERAFNGEEDVKKMGRKSFSPGLPSSQEGFFIFILFSLHLFAMRAYYICCSFSESIHLHK